jgi:hypothetical protein
MQATTVHVLAHASLLALILTLSGCATIVNGSSQSVGIRSDPPGARVYVDGVARGETPAEVDVKRKDRHEVRLELEGHETYAVRLNRSVSPWFAGNLLYGGLIGLGVDAITGSMYQVSPSTVYVVLDPARSMGGER